LTTVQRNDFPAKTPVWPTAPSFVFTVLFKRFVNVLSGYFYVSLNLEATSQSLGLAKFRDTAPTEILISKICLFAFIILQDLFPKFSRQFDLINAIFVL